MIGAPPDFRRVVAIETERLGDLIVATPALRSLRRSLPQAHITLVCPPAIVDVLRGWDAVDEIVGLDANGDHVERRRIVAAMRASAFDLSIALTSNYSAYRLGRRFAARTRAGVVYGANLAHSILAPVFLTRPVRVWIFEPPADGRPIAHRAEELLRVNAALGLCATAGPFELPLAAEDREDARSRLRELGLDRPVVLHLAARWLQEGWTARDVLALAEALRTQGPGRLLLTAGPSDTECAAPFQGDGRFTLLGGLRFREWAAVLEQASAVVTHDTSAVHVTSALRRPVVAVYETTRYGVQSQQWAPWMTTSRVLRKAAPAVTAREVVDATASLLAEVSCA
jgi:ADP-heptose:LPS heptosyltransferase